MKPGERKTVQARILEYAEAIGWNMERMGTDIRDMIVQCRAVGLPEPEFSLTDACVGEDLHVQLRRHDAPSQGDINCRLAGRPLRLARARPVRQRRIWLMVHYISTNQARRTPKQHRERNVIGRNLS